MARVPHRDQAHALVDDAAGARGCPRGRSRVSTLLIGVRSSPDPRHHLTPLTSADLHPAHPLPTPTRTGRNFGYYPKGTKLTATDCSPAMVEVARTKARRMRGVFGGRQGGGRAGAKGHGFQGRQLRYRRGHVRAVQLRGSSRGAAGDGEGVQAGRPTRTDFID